jgi:hypothetical protein
MCNSCIVQCLHRKCNALMTRFTPKWTELVPDFLTYFYINGWFVTPLAAVRYTFVTIFQTVTTICYHYLWYSLAIFSICYTLGVSCTNNSFESFNAVVKQTYMLGVRHTIPALYDILERLVLDVSLDLISGKKESVTKRLPSKEVQLAMKKMDQSMYRVTSLSTFSLRYIMMSETVFVTY